MILKVQSDQGCSIAINCWCRVNFVHAQYYWFRDKTVDEGLTMTFLRYRLGRSLQDFTKGLATVSTLYSVKRVTKATISSRRAG